jgi:hypothetical protein
MIEAPRMIETPRWFNHLERNSMKNIMGKKVIGFVLTGALLVSSVSLAESMKTTATFYDGIPSENAQRLEDDFGQVVQATLVSNAIGQKIHNIEDAKYIDVQMGEQNLVFKIFGGDTTNEMTLATMTNVTTGQDGTSISLGDAVADLEAARGNEQNVAVFTDDDGVVTGFYTFTATNLPTINVEDAETLTLISQQGVTTLQVNDPGVTRLASVQVLEGGNYLPLFQTPYLETLGLL